MMGVIVSTTALVESRVIVAQARFREQSAIIDLAHVDARRSKPFGRIAFTSIASVARAAEWVRAWSVPCDSPAAWRL